METCPACGARVDEGAERCPACGESLRERTVSFEPVGVPAVLPIRATEVTDGPVLVVRKGPEVGERFYLDRPMLTIGRDPASDIFLNDITVSRSHARLEVGAGGVEVADAGSLNGVYVNGTSVDHAILHNGDQLQIGRFQMVFMSGDGE